MNNEDPQEEYWNKHVIMGFLLSGFFLFGNFFYLSHMTWLFAPVTSQVIAKPNRVVFQVLSFLLTQRNLSTAALWREFLHVLNGMLHGRTTESLVATWDGIWETHSGKLKLTLTGHIGQVRGLAVSSRHPHMMFSVGDDKLVKCWDLERDKVVGSYHGHLSGVYCLALHPTLDVLLTGGRDSVCRVWDIRTNMQYRAFSGHADTVCSVFSRSTDPQVITGSHDSTIKLWDLRSGNSMATLTHHKKSVRALAKHPTQESFASASADNIKKFSLPRGEFLHNTLSQQKTIVNAMAVNQEGVLATGGDNGSLWFWDWKSGHSFQQSQTTVQPGSLDSEAGIYALSYDITGLRLVTCGADKTIKMWKQDESATPETHPVNIRRF
ncbi:pleiotropic regulatory locus 1 [Artemisia annua]|uniref:Pleiotropic regulatory locus 1 n=1 Tax=Artemisia annua TaxID=35608 RepID=A0A2U1Q8Y9_ARTAN|nr:pleiotropic regulatory locus 1 [Artemisia annua]